MKSVLLIFFVFALSAGLFAQITVTKATFPAAGDTLRMAVDNSPGAIGSITPPGPQNWDFTGLTAESAFNIIYRSASQGSAGNQVPGAELFAVLSPGTETYYNVTDTKFELQGYYGIVPYDLVANNMFDYPPPLPERHAPLNFFDIHASSTGILELFTPSNFSPLVILQLALETNNAPIDSLRYRVAISDIAAVDAYGSLSIPGGAFDVLREKRTRYTETRIDAKIPPLGWLDITDNAIQAGFNGLGVDTTVSYYFHNDVSKEPIAMVTLDKNQAFATKIVFKNTAPVINAVFEETTEKPSVCVSPNPMSDEVALEFKNLVPGSYRLAIFDETGRMSLEKRMQLGNNHTEPLNSSALPAGVSFFSLFDKTGRVLCQGKLVKKE